MAIRNGDEVRFQGQSGEIRGRVLTISRKGLNKGQAYVFIGTNTGIWIDKERLSKI